VYASLEEHQKEDPLCNDLLEALKRGDPAATQFRLHKSLVLSTERCQKQTVCGSGDLMTSVVEILPRLSCQGIWAR